MSTINETSKLISQYRKRYIFSRFRFHFRMLLVPFFISFSLVDWLYMPEMAGQWFLYRIAYAILGWVGFAIVAKRKSLRDRLESIVAFYTVLVCSIINLMILQSGGYYSKYYIGVILCAIAGVQLFKLNKNHGFFVQSISYLPTIAILLFTAPASELRFAVIQSLFFVGMVLLSYVFGTSDQSNTEMLMKIRYKMKNEIDRLNRTEVLKKFFPMAIRAEIENNINYVPNNRIMKGLIIGFADISNSSEIANSIELKLDWTLKERFLESATQLALKNDMVVLTHIGDGFLFLANYVDEVNWQENVISFYKSLVKEYENIYASTVGVSGSIKSGVKFGLAKGDVMVGFLGKDQAYYTAVGPAVNLAARVCSKAFENELVVTKEVWRDLSAFSSNLYQQVNTYNDIKGFKGSFELVKFSRPIPNKPAVDKNTCPTCHSPLMLTQNSDGQLDYICTTCDASEIKVA